LTRSLGENADEGARCSAFAPPRKKRSHVPNARWVQTADTQTTDERVDLNLALRKHPTFGTGLFGQRTQSLSPTVRRLGMCTRISRRDQTLGRRRRAL